MKKLGLIINSVAGIGGSVGLKGSDTKEIQQLALQRGAVKQSGDKARLALAELASLPLNVEIYAAPGAMGADIVREMGLTYTQVGETGAQTTPEDTRRIAAAMAALPVDALLFSGGDGTARDIYNGIGLSVPAIGVPAGVKIHSAVYAVNPAAAGKALGALLAGQANLREAEVMDLDEAQYRQGRVQAKLYGYLRVPAVRNMMQNPKAASHSGKDDITGICYELQDRMQKEAPDTCYIFGAGSTVKHITDFLQMDGTLLGVDVWKNGAMQCRDAAEADLLRLTKDVPCRLIVTAIGGQGHIFGRGNQQLSPAVLRQIGVHNIWVVAAASKIYALPEQTLYVDTGDEALNDRLRGYCKVIVGWQETLVCRVL